MVDLFPGLLEALRSMVKEMLQRNRHLSSRPLTLFNYAEPSTHAKHYYLNMQSWKWQILKRKSFLARPSSVFQEKALSLKHIVYFCVWPGFVLWVNISPKERERERRKRRERENVEEERGREEGRKEERKTRNRDDRKTSPIPQFQHRNHSFRKLGFKLVIFNAYWWPPRNIVFWENSRNTVMFVFISIIRVPCKQLSPEEAKTCSLKNL